MPKILHTRKDIGKISHLALSDRWFSFRPWTHSGAAVWWLDYRRENRADSIMTYHYFGPFAIITSESKLAPGAQPIRTENES